ncbi:putative lytic transglycosylase [Sphingobium sp. SYK-6]|uniref:lytic transglycosylase domain-containing protein n=1 Tax=Sphingobium sp. (strain NBRC 103272 / SYK-6) TaxID=627192 RepID=UPI00022776D1|nr:putative lytic transglycosylase [Sphingobium sp. SYK-6]
MYRMGKDLRLPAIVIAAALASGATSASAPQSATTVTWEAVRERIAANSASDAQITSAIGEWRRLASSDALGFAAYADFLLGYPGWPDEGRLRGNAERLADPDMDDPGKIIRFFERYPATTAQGKAVHALALARLARFEDARGVARAAWIAGPMDPKYEEKLRGQFFSVFTADDHLKRADAALWRRRADVAERVLPSVPVTRQAVVAARIAFQRKAADAALKMGPADPVGAMDAGYLADKARWMAENGDSAGVRTLLANRMTLMQRPGDAERWYELLLAHARAAGSDSQWSNAYAIASKVDDAFEPGTDVSAQPLGVRDDYTSLVWLAGTAALNKLGRPADAEGMFVRYATGARSPQTVSKGYYWAGRAAAAAGRQSVANEHFARAAAFPDQYYGQLALERQGKAIPAPPAAERRVEIAAAQRKAFLSRPIVQATLKLGRDGAWMEQSRFVRALASTAETDEDHVLVAELSQMLGRPDLGVMVGRRAMANGLSGYADASFPRMKVPDRQQMNWTMIHAITRQESQFDRAIISRAGARGLMQLMPATAREVAGKIGMSYDTGSLFEPHYNIELGSTYFSQLLRYYGGSYPLAVAAYNGGMGNVNKWLKANGDPRLPGADIVQWIEDIPIYETRNYVQRVLENAVIYDLVNPTRQMASSSSSAPLSRYLGKQRPG